MNQINVYVMSTDIIKGKMDEIYGKIAPSYRKKSDSMNRETGKLQELGAGYLLASVLGVVEDSMISRNEHGKPELTSGSERFNISHEKKYVVLATSTEQVGVDIQELSEHRENVVKRIFPEDMKRELEERTDVQEKAVLFTKDWTIIESVLKCDGRGFAVPREEIKALVSEYHTQSLEYQGHYITCACPDDFELKLIEVE